MAEETTSGDPYDIVLADLKAQRAKIDQAIAAIESLRRPGSVIDQPVIHAQPAPAGAAVTAGMFHSMSIVEAAKRLLDMRKKPLSTQEITEAIISGGVVFSTQTPANTVSSVLHRHAKTVGEIISVGRALWGLAVWYPNSGRFKKKKATNETQESPLAAAASIQQEVGEGEDTRESWEMEEWERQEKGL